MSAIKLAYGTSTPFTITLASLANGATSGQESTVVDNTSDLYMDASAQVIVTISSGTPANDKAAYVYAYGSDGSTNYSGGATGSNAAINLAAPTAMRLIGVIPMPTAATAVTYQGQPMSVAAAFGGIMPRKWGIVVRNYSGLSLTSSTTLNVATWSGISYTST